MCSREIWISENAKPEEQTTQNIRRNGIEHRLTFPSESENLNLIREKITKGEILNKAEQRVVRRLLRTTSEPAGLFLLFEFKHAITFLGAFSVFWLLLCRKTFFALQATIFRSINFCLSSVAFCQLRLSFNFRKISPFVLSFAKFEYQVNSLSI